MFLGHAIAADRTAEEGGDLKAASRSWQSWSSQTSHRSHEVAAEFPLVLSLSRELDMAAGPSLVVAGAF